MVPSGKKLGPAARDTLASAAKKKPAGFASPRN
jgi:hypothetical protein